MVVSSAEMKKKKRWEEEMVWSKGETFSFEYKVFEVMVEHPSRDDPQVAWNMELELGLEVKDH